MDNSIAVLDFGGQYAHLIANRVRRLGVYSEIFDGQTPAEKLKDYKGIILSGGPQSVYGYDAIHCDKKILDLNVPLLGICYGHQLLAYIQGGEVVNVSEREYGPSALDIKKSEGIFKNIYGKKTVWMSHGDTIAKLPDNYEIIASTSDCEYAAIANFKKNYYGTQFHLEVTHTQSGQEMLGNFLDICGCSRDWKIENFIDQEMETIKKQVGNRKVFMMVSGGVDSTVAFVLLEKTLGRERVYGLFVDTGFMRLGEKEEVSSSLSGLGFNNLHIRDESKRFFQALKEKYDPEAKRKIIGDLFLKVQADVVKDLKLNSEEWLLGQGTIYPDTIETGGTKHAAKIKTHHNRVPQIEELMQAGRIIEPLAQLYKDEVREVGLRLGLPEKIVWRHPFPGPGLAVRCLCAHEASYPEHHVLVEKKINNMIHPFNLTAKILPVKSVGVQGDYRTYQHPLAIIGNGKWENFGPLATQLINQFKEINRVIWLCEPNIIDSLSVQKKYLSEERIQMLQKADAMVHEFLFEYGLYSDIWQFPVVLLPVSVNRESGEAIVLRPVSSEEAMTANFYPMEHKLLQQLSKKLMNIPGITAVFYDITNKPPGTIEWE